MALALTYLKGTKADFACHTVCINGRQLKLKGC